MIQSAAAFIRLRTSSAKADYDRAASEEAPIEVWRDLVKNHPDMKSWVAHNKTVPMEILEILAADRESDVRNAVARKRKLTKPLFEKLARDADEGVRLAVAYNANTPDEVLRLLVDDTWEQVAAKAKARLAGEP
jgi:hypothetical protein